MDHCPRTIKKPPCTSRSVVGSCSPRRLDMAMRSRPNNAIQTGNQTQAEDPHVFPSRSVKNSPITEHALAVAMARFSANLDPDEANSWIKDPPTPHDLRRTVATRLAQMGFPKEDRDAVLNHTPQDVGKKHYDLYEREREKRLALNAWSDAVLAILATPNETNANGQHATPAERKEVDLAAQLATSGDQVDVRAE